LIFYVKILPALNVKGDTFLSAHRTNGLEFEYEKRLLNKNSPVFQHYHDFFEIYFLESGSCHYFIDNDSYNIEAGDIVLIPKGIIHKTMYEEGEAKRRLIYCSYNYIPPSVIPYFSSILYIYRNPKITERVLKLFNAIEEEYSSGDGFSEDILMHYMHLFFFLLARNSDIEMPKKTGSVYTTQTVAYIKEKYAENIKLPDIAKRFSVSPEHLSRIFKRDTGLGISEYLSTVRLQQSQLLLRSSPELSISEIAERCGFYDSNYFSKRFKESYCISPLRFRKYTSDK
jgi:AraC-like DNA-binding protein/quercetin dioxygenase-like cupin family protein